MKKTIFFLAMITIGTSAFSQDKYFTKSGKLGFDATVPKSPENIDAVNKAALCVLDIKTGDVQFSCLMKGFEFDKSFHLDFID